MNTGANGASSTDLPPDMLGGSGSGKTTATDDDSGLIDIKNMARSTKRRVSQRISTEHDVEESLLASSRPSALRDVVLPEPGKEAPPMALGSEVGAAAADAAVAVDSPAPEANKGGSWVALAAAVVLIGGGVAGWFALKGGSDSGEQSSAAVASGETEAVASQGARGGEPPAVAPDPADEPGGIAADTDDDTAAADDADGADGADGAIADADDSADADDDGSEKVAVARADRGANKSGGKSSDGPKSRSSSKKDSPKASKDEPKGKADEPEAVAKKGSGEPDFEDLLDNATGGAQAPKGAGADKADEPEKKKPTKIKLSRADIKTGMRSVHGRVAACYTQFKVPGTVSVKVKIDNTGVVTSATATGKFANTDTGACVSKAVTAASFPEFDGPPMSFAYPFLLQ